MLTLWYREGSIGISVSKKINHCKHNNSSDPSPFKNCWSIKIEIYNYEINWNCPRQDPHEKVLTT